MGMEGIGFGTNKMGGMEGPIGGGMKNMGRFGSGMNMGRINGKLCVPTYPFLSVGSR